MTAKKPAAPKAPKVSALELLRLQMANIIEVAPQALAIALCHNDTSVALVSNLSKIAGENPQAETALTLLQDDPRAFMRRHATIGLRDMEKRRQKGAETPGDISLIDTETED